jgi:hypothetical protein
MRLTFIIVLNCCLFFLHAGGYDYISKYAFSRPDTVSPPPPPGGADPISGPASACVGETSEYSVDVPVSCICQWAVNGIIQTDTTSSFIITWTQSGLQIVSVIFLSAGEQTSEGGTILVIVFETPQPQPISGDSVICEYTYHTYSTIVGSYDSCEWKVNGVIQPGYSPIFSYSFGAAGIYQLEVTAFNPCGISIPQALEVTAQGTAPSPPSPVQGAGESCEGNAEIYSTSVGPGEFCAWWVDGVLQPSTGVNLEVTWAERGDHLIEVRAVSDCGTGNPTFKNVLVLYQPGVFLGNDTTILQGQTLILDAGNAGSDYLWSTGDTTQTLPVNASGTYMVDVSNFCGADTDTIEVSVIVGLVENKKAGDCFRVILHHGKINFSDLPQGLIKIQVINLTGMICYEGPPVSVINIDHAGIYLIRITSKEATCYQKVFIR